MRAPLALLTILGCSGSEPQHDDALAKRAVAAFEAVGDRVAAELRAEAARPHRSRIAVVESLASATPVAFYRHIGTLKQHGLSAADLAALDAGTREQAMAAMVAREQPAILALMSSIEPLPASDIDDCRALDLRIDTLRHGSPQDRELAATLAVGMTSCVHP